MSNVRRGAHIGWSCLVVTATFFPEGGCTVLRDRDEHLGTIAGALQNGTTDSNAVYLAVGSLTHSADPTSIDSFNQQCTGTYIAPRVVLIAGHCVDLWLAHCRNLALPSQSLGFVFAPPDGAFASAVTANFRRARVLAIRSPALAANLNVENCSNSICQGSHIDGLDYSNDIALLFLDRDAPPDVGNDKVPRILIDPNSPALLSPSSYVAKLGAFPGLESWAAATKPNVTVVGFGAGSHTSSYPFPANPSQTVTLASRDFGVAEWSYTSYGYGTAKVDCDGFGPAVGDRAVVGTKADGSGFQSDLGYGDSGGPVFAGMGPAAQNAPEATPTPLPPSCVPPHCDPAARYLIGVESAGAGLHTATYTAETTKFLTDNLKDVDKDGIADGFDLCMGGDDKVDWDHDGNPDKCDPCPCDASVVLFDNDFDGICANPCTGEPRDNCATAHNKLQENCNALSEQAHLSLTVRLPYKGDACDSAICPAATALAAPALGTFASHDCPYNGGTPESSCGPPPPNVKTWLYCGTYLRNQHDLRPLGSHGADGTFVAPSFAVGTEARHCQAIKDVRTCVDLQLDIQDARIDESGLVTSTADESAGTRFLRVEQHLGNGLIAPDDAPPNHFYEWDIPEGTSLASKLPPLPYTWEYSKDFLRWTAPGKPLSSLGLGSAAALRGTFWRHANASYGGTIDIGKGARGPELNNNHVAGYALQGYSPEETRCTACGILKLPQPNFDAAPSPSPAMAAASGPPNIPYLVWRPSTHESPGDFVRVEQAPLEANVLIPAGSGQVVAASGNCGGDGGQLVTAQVGAWAIAQLQDPNVVWANAVEPLADLGAGTTFPTAVGLSPTGTQIVTTVRSTGASLAAPGDAPACTASAAPIAPAFVRAFGTLGSGQGELSSQVGVGVDGGDNVFVTDRDNFRVCKFGPDGGFLKCWGQQGSADGEFGGQPGGGGDGPYGIDVDKQLGRVCVADTINSRVQCFDGSGNFLFAFGSFGVGPAQFAFEFGLGSEPTTHEIYVADTFGHRIQVFDAAGNYLREWGSFGQAPGQLGYPRDVAVDTRGNVYVAEFGNSRISKFDRQGNFIATWGTPGSAPGELLNPHAVAVDAGGLVYVADFSNNRVQVFSPTGAFVTRWGSYGTGNAQFRGAIGVDLDAHGQVYVSDHFNNRVQVFEALANACAGCPSGQCAADRPGVCCEQTCVGDADCPSRYCSPALHVCAALPSSGSPHALGFVAVATRARRGVFVVGGRDPSTSQPTGEIWFNGLDEGAWRLVAVDGYAPVDVLAATYSFSTRKLYVVDVTAGGNARLTALTVDGAQASASVLGTFQRDPAWDKIDLVPDLDGALLLASSSTKQKKHAIARINVNVAPVKVDGIDKANRELVIPPVVDGAGYTLLLRQDEGNDKIKRQRVKTLTLKPATFADVDSQL
jgi:DNA-binding beta-propeller fold protein YncE